jgi:hypothetical protein
MQGGREAPPASAPPHHEPPFLLAPRPLPCSHALVRRGGLGQGTRIST